MSVRRSFLAALLLRGLVPWLGRCLVPCLVPSLVMAAVLLPVASAQANPVNAEKLLSDPVEGGFSGSFNTSFALSTGNVERLSLGVGGGMQYWTLHPEGAGHGDGPTPEGAPRFFKDRWVLIANGQFVRFALSEVVNSGFAHMRYTRMLLPRLGPDVFTQAQYNQFTRLNLRMLAGTGLRVDPIRRRRVQVWAGTGYMAELERYDVVAEDPHPSEVVNHRWTSYGVLQLQLWDAAVVARSTTYAQPRFDDFRDFRLLESIQIEARAVPVLALGIELEVQYDSRPPLVSGVQPLDLFLTSYVRIGGPNR